MSLLIKYKERKGYKRIVTPHIPPLLKGDEGGFSPFVREGIKGGLQYIEFGIISLKGGKSYKGTINNEETVLVIIEGSCEIRCEGESYKLSRKNVFEETASAVYISKNAEYEVISKDKVLVAVCKAEISNPPLIPPLLKGGEGEFNPYSKEGKGEFNHFINEGHGAGIYHIRQSEVEKVHRGKDGFQRDVHNILVNNVDVKAKRILVGETFTPACNWSSYPPHKHDKNSDEEVKLEEVYFFKVNPSQGFGMIRLYSDDRKLDRAYGVCDNDTVIIPEGYHPVSAAPGYDLYYLWVLAGEQRVMKVSEDKNHNWIAK